MEDIYVIKNGKKEAINIITCFKFNNNSYCIYSLANGEKEDIYCGRLEEGILKKIEDSAERSAINLIVKDIFESAELDEDGDFIHIQVEGQDVVAEVLDVMEVNDDEYMILSVKTGEMTSIFAMKAVNEGNETRYVNLTPDEQELLIDTMKDILE